MQFLKPLFYSNLEINAKIESVKNAKLSGLRNTETPRVARLKSEPDFENCIGILQKKKI